MNRPLTMSGTTSAVQTSVGVLYVTTNYNEDGDPKEVFAQLGKSGWSYMADAQAIASLVTIALQAGVKLSIITKQLRNIGGGEPHHFNGSLVRSVPDAIAIALEGQEKQA